MKHSVVSTRLLLLSGVALVLAGAPQMTFKPFHESGIYQLGEKAGWTVSGPAGHYTYTIRKNNLDTIKTGAFDLDSGSATIETTLNEPAMLYADVNPGAFHLGAAIAPTKLEPSAARPADFDAFWDGKLKALAEVPVNPVLTPAEAGKPGVELYTVKLDSLGSHVQGYLAKPARAGKFPAMVIYQWAGVYALQPEWSVGPASEGWLVLDVDSHDLPPSQATGVPDDYQTIGNSSRDTSYFLNMYLRDQTALHYIASRPDWDGRTLVVTGTSMGGQQSLVAAALNHKVTAVVVNEPSGADTNGDLHGRKAGYPFWPVNDPKVAVTALYFDPVNFARHIQAPVLAGIGFIDEAAPPAGIWTAMNQIPGPKEVISMVESAHNNITPDKQGEYLARAKEVLDFILHGGEYVPGGQRPGFVDTPYLPGQPWHVHDPHRPYPRIVAPGVVAGQPPSDAVVLFDGKDLSHWMTVRDGKQGPPQWKLGPGWMEVTNTGDLVSKEKFGDAQVHVEWAAPDPATGSDQMRGNSGVIVMSRYEVQVLDNYNNPTYADGWAGAIYGQYPPLVTPLRRPGQWQTYDIVFEAPRFEGQKLVKPAYMTVFQNGVLIQNHRELIGRMVYRQVATYAPHAAEEPLMLQDHGCPVRYRNIWVRPLEKAAD
jgi:cephalosporin-C deacetylase